MYGTISAASTTPANIIQNRLETGLSLQSPQKSEKKEKKKRKFRDEDEHGGDGTRERTDMKERKKKRKSHHEDGLERDEEQSQRRKLRKHKNSDEKHQPDEKLKMDREVKTKVKKPKANFEEPIDQKLPVATGTITTRSKVPGLGAYEDVLLQSIVKAGAKKGGEQTGTENLKKSIEKDDDCSRGKKIRKGQDHKRSGKKQQLVIEEPASVEIEEAPTRVAKSKKNKASLIDTQMEGKPTKGKKDKKRKATPGEEPTEIETKPANVTETKKEKSKEGKGKASKKAAEAKLQAEGEWETFSILQLKEELKKRGLPKHGNKDKLVARLDRVQPKPDATGAGGLESTVANLRKDLFKEMTTLGMDSFWDDEPLMKKQERWSSPSKLRHMTGIPQHKENSLIHKSVNTQEKNKGLSRPLMALSKINSESWEIKPGWFRGHVKVDENVDDDEEIAENIAFASRYITSRPKGIKISNITFQVNTIELETSHLFNTQAISLRVCSVAKGKVHVTLGTQSLKFGVSENGMWRIKVGERCVARNLEGEDAVIHVFAVE